MRGCPMRARVPSRFVLRALMHAYGLKSPDVAFLVNRQPQTVRAWLCGVRAIPSGAWKRIVNRWPVTLGS